MQFLTLYTRSVVRIFVVDWVKEYVEYASAIRIGNEVFFVCHCHSTFS